MSDKISLQEAMDSAFYRLEKLEKNGLKKLWENPNPDVSFPAQNITLSSDDYDYLVIFAFNNATNKSNTFSTTCLKGYGAILNYIVAYSTTGIFVVRFINRISDTEFTIDDCKDQRGSQLITNNDAAIPIAIYGGHFAK